MGSTLLLIDVLKGVGMTEMYKKPTADFTGIAKETNVKGNLYVSQVIQKAMIEVGEEGTEATAASLAVVNLFKSAKVDLNCPVQCQPSLCLFPERPEDWDASLSRKGCQFKSEIEIRKDNECCSCEQELTIRNENTKR